MWKNVYNVNENSPHQIIRINKWRCVRQNWVQVLVRSKKPYFIKFGSSISSADVACGLFCSTLFQQLTRGLFWCLFPELRSNEGNKHQNNTRVSAETVRHESTYIILFPTRHNESINYDKKDDLYTTTPCLTRSVVVLLMTSQSIADDVTMTRQFGRDHANSDI